MAVTRSVVISFSPTGTTKKVLEAVAQGLGIPTRTVDMTLPRARTEPIALGPDEIVLIGFPVYAGRIPDMYPQVLDMLPAGTNPVVPVVVYGNRHYDDALLELADLCVGKGYQLAGAGCFIAQHSYDANLATGRPDATDVAVATAFGAQVSEALAAGKTLSLEALPGKRPYKEVMAGLRLIPAPVADADRCNQCGVCVRHCPSGAIAPENPLVTDATLCIMCAACIVKCPTLARDIPSPVMRQHMAEIARNNAAPKTPETFLP